MSLFVLICPCTCVALDLPLYVPLICRSCPLVSPDAWGHECPYMSLYVLICPYMSLYVPLICAQVLICPYMSLLYARRLSKMADRQTRWITNCSSTCVKRERERQRESESCIDAWSFLSLALVPRGRAAWSPPPRPAPYSPPQASPVAAGGSR